MWNKAKVEALLTKSNFAVERAILAIYERQTQDEKVTSDTRHRNARGFSAAHVSKGSYYARWILGGRHLTGRHLENARKIAMHYTQQLVDVANANAPKPSVDIERIEREMQLMEAQGDREGTERDERNKFVAKSRMERREPPVGSYAATARLLAECGAMTGEEADAWKDMMKDGDE